MKQHSREIGDAFFLDLGKMNLGTRVSDAEFKSTLAKEVVRMLR